VGPGGDHDVDSAGGSSCSSLEQGLLDLQHVFQETRKPPG
jgi:hypothetical protein